MNSISAFVLRAVRFVIAATLALAGFVIAVGLLALMAVVGLAVVAVALVTGRRPQLRMASRLDPWSAWRRAWSGRTTERARPSARGSQDVIDVEAREIGGPPREP